jgi:hypothetical protein
MRSALAVAAAALVVPALATGAGGKVFFQDTVPSGKASSVTITTHRAASFSVLLRVPTAGRAKLYLLGKKAPKGGPLIDTKTYGCEGAAGSFYCEGVVRAAAGGHVHLEDRLAECGEELSTSKSPYAGRVALPLPGLVYLPPSA